MIVARMKALGNLGPLYQQNIKSMLDWRLHIVEAALVAR